MTTALYLIPVTIGDTPLAQVLPAYNSEVIRGISHFVVEEIRTARRFLKQVDKSIDIDALHFYPMGKHADEALYAQYLAPLAQGQSVGVISEAGCPGVADPGAAIAAIAHRMGHSVVPLVGPSSILLALMASGCNGQSFAFNGYLPVDPTGRTARLKRLETLATADGQTQLFIETPYRNVKMWEDILRTLRPTTKVCIAAGITTPTEIIRTLSVAEWKKRPTPEIAKVPAIFIIGG